MTALLIVIATLVIASFFALNPTPKAQTVRYDKTQPRHTPDTHWNNLG